MSYIDSVNVGGTSYKIQETVYITPSLSSSAYTADLSNFTLATGATVQAKFATTNPANATLNVNSTGAKEIHYNGTKITASQFKVNHVYTLVYDGTQWQVVGDIDTNTTYSLSGLSGIGTINASGTAPLTLSGSKSGTTYTLTGSIADASASASGVVNTDAQTFSGVKIFDNGLHIYGTISTQGTGSVAGTMYPGGAYHSGHNSIILHGDTAGVSGIGFTSEKATKSGTTTNINGSSDRAFIQYHAYGVTPAAEGTAPTLATSGELGTLVIGVGNDATDTIRLQAPGTAGILHQIGATAYPIPHTTNTNGSVGGTTTPVYVEAGVIKAGIALGTASQKAESYFVKAITSTDEAIVRFSGTAGQVQDSKTKIDDNGTIILPAEQDIRLRMNRKNAEGSGWAHGYLNWYDNADNIFARMGVYGNGDTLIYLYLGADDYHSQNNLQIAPDGTIYGKLFSGSGASLTNLNGSNISSGTVADARIASSIARLASPTFTGTPTAPTAANGTSTTQIATTEFVNNTLAYVNAMQFKGTLGTGGTVTSLPASHNAGDTYRVITADTWAGKYCEVGTLIICTTDGTAANDTHWTAVETNEDGAVIGPTSSTDNAIVRFNGSSGRIIQNSTVSIADNGFIMIGNGATGSISLTNGGTWYGMRYADNDNPESGLGNIRGTSNIGIFKNCSYTNDSAETNLGFRGWYKNASNSYEVSPSALVLEEADIKYYRGTKQIYAKNAQIIMTGYTIAHSGNVTTGDANGQVKIAGQNIDVAGLGSAAYTESNIYATAAQGTKADNALPLSGGTMTGAITSNKRYWDTAPTRADGAIVFDNAYHTETTSGTYYRPWLSGSESVTSKGYGNSWSQGLYAEGANNTSMGNIGYYFGTAWNGSATTAYVWKFTRGGNSIFPGNITATSFTGDAIGKSSSWLAYPGGGTYSTTTSSVTGALKVILPQVAKNTMMSFDVNIYTYEGSNATSTVYHISGYEYSANGWHNPVCRVYSEGTGVYTNLTVRFGSENSKAYITIGETNTVWSYPQVAISNVLLGYSNDNFATWGTGWSINFVTTLPTTQTGSRNGVNTQSINITGSALKFASTKLLTSSDDENSLIGGANIVLYGHSNTNRPTNCPTASYNAGLFVLPSGRANGDTFQLEYSCNTGDIYTRSWLAGNTPPEWRTILNSGNTYAANTNDSDVAVTCGTSTTLATINGTAVKIKVTKPTYNYSDVGAAPAVDGGYLPLSGGIMTGNINMGDMGTPSSYPTSGHKITWTGGTDGAQIYYHVASADAGRLVFNTTDDTNCLMALAYNGTFKAYFNNSTPSFYPATTNTGSLGLSDHIWSIIYAHTISNSVINSTQTSMRHIDAGKNAVQADHNLYIGYGAQSFTNKTLFYYSTGTTDTTSSRTQFAEINKDGLYALTRFGIGGQNTDYTFYADGNALITGNSDITGIKYYTHSTNAGKTYIGWVKIASFNLNTSNHFGNQIIDVILSRTYNSPSSEVYYLRISVGWENVNIVQLSGRADTRIIEQFRVVRDNNNHIIFLEYYVNTDFTTYSNVVNIKFIVYHGAALTLLNEVQTEAETAFANKWAITTASNGIVGDITGNVSGSAGSVAWSNVTSKPIEFITNTGALNSNGWKTLGGRSSGAKIAISYASSSPATWNSSAYSASLVFGCNDTKGLLDLAYYTPVVTFGGASVNGSTDNDPKWYFKLSGTSGKTYTFPSDSKTLAAADGSNASGAWSISIPWANTNHPDTFPPTIGTTSTTAMAGNTTVNQVKQSSSSLQNKWRKVILGYSEYTASNTAVGDAVTNVTYMAQDVAVQPYTGAMRANSYKVTDNVTLQWNSTDSSLDFVFA